MDKQCIVRALRELVTEGMKKVPNAKEIAGHAVLPGEEYGFCFIGFAALGAGASLYDIEAAARAGDFSDTLLCKRYTKGALIEACKLHGSELGDLATFIDECVERNDDFAAQDIAKPASKVLKELEHIIDNEPVDSEGYGEGE